MVVAEKLQGTKNGYCLRTLLMSENDICLLKLLNGKRHPSSHFINLKDAFFLFFIINISEYCDCNERNI